MVISYVRVYGGAYDQVICCIALSLSPPPGSGRIRLSTWGFRGKKQIQDFGLGDFRYGISEAPPREAGLS